MRESKTRELFRCSEQDAEETFIIGYRYAEIQRIMAAHSSQQGLRRCGHFPTRNQRIQHHVAADQT